MWKRALVIIYGIRFGHDISIAIRMKHRKYHRGIWHVPWRNASLMTKHVWFVTIGNKRFRCLNSSDPNHEKKEGETTEKIHIKVVKFIESMHNTNRRIHNLKSRLSCLLFPCCGPKMASELLTYAEGVASTNANDRKLNWDSLRESPSIEGYAHTEERASCNTTNVLHWHSLQRHEHHFSWRGKTEMHVQCERVQQMWLFLPFTSYEPT